MARYKSYDYNQAMLVPVCLHDQLQPGTLEWFRAASFVRVPAETGLEVRLVPRVTEGGFDPAAGYRPFEETIERLNA